MRSVSTGGRQLTHAALAARQLAVETPEVSRKELGKAARDAMKALGLRSSLRLVLSEIVGCWGEKMVDDRILVWPSNEYLTLRTGLSERAVRYAIRELVSESALTAKDSANGKRFAIKGAGGRVLDAFGFDLTPLYAKREEWAQRVQAQKEARDARRRVFDEITICRRATEEALSALATAHPEVDRGAIERELVELTEKTPRRTAVGIPTSTLNDLQEAYRKLRQLAEKTFYESGNGGKSCRLIESTSKNNINDWNNGLTIEGGQVENHSPPIEPVSLKLILEACPALEIYSEPITSERAFIEAGRLLRSSIGAHETAWLEAVEKLGALRAAILVAITLQLHENDQGAGVKRILNPGGYFRQLTRMTFDGRFDISTELMALRRKRLG